MIQINKFIDKVSLAETKKQNTLVLSIDDARYLRDEISKLLSDLHDDEKKVPDVDTLNVVMTGGSFK